MNPKRDTDRPMLGIAHMILAMSIVPLLDLCAKFLGDVIPVAQLTMMRYLIHSVLILPVMIVTGIRIVYWPRQWRAQIMRGFFLVATTALFFLAIRDVPIPDALALTFIAPLIVTLLSPIFLGESLGIRRLSATLVGFVGVIIVINPSIEGINSSSLYALAAGLCFAFYLIITRQLSGGDPALTTLLFAGIVGLILSTPFAIPVWIAPNTTEWLLLLGLGTAAVIGHYFVILAFKYGQASVVAPFEYFEIITAVLYSFLLFGTFPAAHVWAGMAVIIGAGVYISWRERQLEMQSSP